MHIEDFEEDVPGHENDRQLLTVSRHVVSGANAKRLLVGAGARVLFYPTLLYNVYRNKMEPEFRWWDQVHEFVLLGAVPFPKDVPRLRQLGVLGVVTLNEPYETLVPSSLYQVHGIEHLVLPTRDYLFAPALADICRAVDFINRNVSSGRTTYVHCKAGRGRSTTIVLCYLVKHRNMTPAEAYEHVRSIRPRVLLAPSQWQAVLDYHKFMVLEKNTRSRSKVSSSLEIVPASNPIKPSIVDDGSMVLVTKSDLDGYDGLGSIGPVGNSGEPSFVGRVQFAGQVALARLSCMWLPSIGGTKMGSRKGRLLQPGSTIKSIEGTCSAAGTADNLGRNVDITVY